MSAASNRLRDYGKLVKAAHPLTVIEQLSSGVEDLVRVAPDDKAKGRVLNYFGLHHYQAGDNTSALDLFHRSFELNGEVESLCNALIISRSCKSHESVGRLNIAAQIFVETMPDSIEKANLYDVLCHNCGARGDMDDAAKFGRESLRLKDLFATEPIQCDDRVKPTFNFFEPKRNVISFSLYGANPRYTRTAIENAEAVQHVYPGWSCRFYADKFVPHDVISRLAQLGADVRVMPEPHRAEVISGMFWRFLVAGDKDVDFFLIRDADSLISVREKVAIDEWINSDKAFHVIRDFYTHSELLNGGLWGGVAGRLSTIADDIRIFLDGRKQTVLGSCPYDQLFLRNHIWPAIRHDLMQHDSVFKGAETRDFPAVGTIHPVRHIGQDVNIFRNSK